MSSQPRTDTPILQCVDLCKTFSDGKLKVEVLKGIALSIFPGEQVAIMGSSGSGKSTLLHILGGLDVPTRGKVLINQQNLNTLDTTQRGRLRNQFMGFVYQFHHLLPEFTALENVALPLLIRGESLLQVKEKASTILEKVGLKERINHKPSELSGGERQRTAIARALVTRPLCVLADEPTGNLDHKTADRIYQLMLELNAEMGTSIVMVTHDPDLAKRMQRTLILEDGVIIDAS